MRLEDMAVTLRPRTAAEAIDLGYAMTQTWWKGVFGAWCAVYLPVAIIICLLFWQMPVLAVFVLWWLKPAFDRVVLQVLSGATFGATPTLRNTMRALPRLWWNNTLFAALTYARFNMARSFTLPVTQLEGSRGKIARQRRRILGREGWSAATWLTIITLHIEVTLIASCYFLVNLFSPGEAAFQLSWQLFFNPEISRSTQLFGYGVNVLVVSVLEPFYVAAGFAIYLNCRTAIEGWDVELAFKRLAARLAQARAVSPVSAGSAIKLAASLLLGITMAMASLSVPDAAAQAAPAKVEDVAVETIADAVEMEKDKKNSEEKSKVNAATELLPAPFTPDTGARKAAQRILAAPEFGRNRDGWRLRYIGPGWGEREPVKPYKWTWLEAFVKFVAESLRVLAWMVVALVVAGLLYLIARHVNVNGWRRATRAAPPDMLFGLDVRPESLPDHLPAAVRELLARGEIRAAVGLLYRASLVSLIEDGRIEINRGDTEGECVQRVRLKYLANPRELAKAEYFDALVRQWQRVAYARAPTNSAELTQLVDNWALHFSLRAQAGEQNAAMSAPQAQS